MSSLTAGDVTSLAAAAGLLLITMILVAAEEAITRFSVVRAEALAEQSPKQAERLAALVEQPEAARNPLRLIILGAQILQGVLVALVATRHLPWPWAVVVIAADIALAFVVAEAVPRTMAILHTDQVGLMAAGPLGLLLRLAPIRLTARILIAITNWVVPGSGLRSGPFSIPEELVAFADAAMEDEVIEQTERDLIESAITFGDTIVRAVMVPRTDMRTVAQHFTVANVLDFASSEGFSRFPIVGENTDDVLGLVYVKDLIRSSLDGQNERPVIEMAREAWFVPETKKVSDLLQEMQEQKAHMAVAVDEYGGIAGLVTLEDIIEELVGEIVDEYDVEGPMLTHEADGSIKVDARISIDELNDVADLNLPEGDWDTVAGLVFDTFGRVPTRGQSCEVDGYRLRVDGLRGRRITWVTVWKPTSTEPETVEQSHAVQ